MRNKWHISLVLRNKNSRRTWQNSVSFRSRWLLRPRFDKNLYQNHSNRTIVAIEMLEPVRNLFSFNFNAEVLIRPPIKYTISVYVVLLSSYGDRKDLSISQVANNKYYSYSFENTISLLQSNEMDNIYKLFVSSVCVKEGAVFDAA